MVKNKTLKILSLVLFVAIVSPMSASQGFRLAGSGLKVSRTVATYRAQKTAKLAQKRLAEQAAAQQQLEKEFMSWQERCNNMSVKHLRVEIDSIWSLLHPERTTKFDLLKQVVKGRSAEQVLFYQKKPRDVFRLLAEGYKILDQKVHNWDTDLVAAAYQRIAHSAFKKEENFIENTKTLVGASLGLGALYLWNKKSKKTASK